MEHWWNRCLSESLTGSTRIRILNKRPLQVESWMDGRLTETNSYRNQKRFGQNCGPQCPERKLHEMLLHEVEEFDATVQNAKKKLEVPVERAMPYVKQIRIPTANAPTQKVAVSNKGARRPVALSEGRPSLTRRRISRQLAAFESQRCILHKVRDHSHEDHVADRGFHSWHHRNLITKAASVECQKVRSKQDILHEARDATA